MLKTTGSSVTSASRVDDDKLVGGGRNWLSPKVEQKVGSIV